MRSTIQDDFGDAPLERLQWMNEYDIRLTQFLKCFTSGGYPLDGDCPLDDEMRKEMRHIGRLQGCTIRTASTDE
ncbi:hypothetical protein JCGZ_22985 [Jatropha curcas]|uniref:Uncharacterized protein n=1 Tax=Jatropha curcas TaxID=180498 RepID=A0A067K276_JATCU|nr:hypothetical protein JCGZ_22985 [Jatropha curcas]